MPPTKASKKTAPKPAPKAAKKTVKKPWIWSHTHISLYLIFVNLTLTLIIGAALYGFIALDVPDIDSIAGYQPAAATFFFDSQGQVIDRVANENRVLTGLDSMPKLLPKAFVAAEDARFYHHSGVDGWSILRALIHNIKIGGRGQGGSTITQQVARALLLSPEKTYTRKVKEAILAYKIDKFLSKEDILHIYLNQIYLGERAYGVGAAAHTYFGKEVNDLNLAEITILAGLPQAPSRYSPLKNLKLAKRRQAYVLNRMAEDGYITPTSARKAYTRELYWAGPSQPPVAANYFLQYVKNYVRKKYGNDMLREGGLKIYTTINPVLQKAARTAVDEGVTAWQNRTGNKSHSPQAALVAQEVSTGKIRALVGGVDFKKSQFNRAIQAKRQPGSAFKPIIYAAALNSGLMPNTQINDEPTQFKGGQGETWEPKNFSGEFYGPTTLRNGLEHSRNIVTIKILQEVGLGPATRLARAMGIRSPLTSNLSLALGSSELSLLELTSAYRVFSNNGAYSPPAFIDKIVDRHGKILERFNSKATHQVLDENVAYQITSMLQGVIERGTGSKARGLKEAAGKTGTTDQNMDAWFIGYTPKITTGVWFGFDKHRSLGSRETGGRTAAPVWLSFMKKAEKLEPAGEFKVPSGITYIPVDRETGDFEYIDTDNALWEAFRKDNIRKWQDRVKR